MKPPFIWDAYSDQPQVITDKAYKKQQKKAHIGDYIKLLASSLFILPIAALLMKCFRGKQTCQVGLCVNLDKGNAQPQLVQELGVRHLAMRMPLWDMAHLPDYVSFAQSFGADKDWLITLLQDREHIEDIALLKQDIHAIFAALGTISNTFQVGNAINRSKWGFFSVAEYAKFYWVVQEIRDTHYPHIRLIGPSVIDFEYYYTVRALFNGFKIKFDALASLLYVDRRGAPQNTQYGIFDTANKINLLYTLAKLSHKTTHDIYITEVNWPLKHTAPYAPTSELECVSEQDYARFMLDYLNICLSSKKVSRVYWHQLIAPGYGLVDNRNGQLRKMPAFEAFKQWMAAHA